MTDWDFTPNEAAAQAYIFFLAGIETSSLIIQYALYEMSINPIIQDRARTEVFSVLEKHGKITYDALNDMEYLNKVIQGKIIPLKVNFLFNLSNLQKVYANIQSFL